MSVPWSPRVVGDVRDTPSIRTRVVPPTRGRRDACGWDQNPTFVVGVGGQRHWNSLPPGRDSCQKQRHFTLTTVPEPLPLFPSYN